MKQLNFKSIEVSDVQTWDYPDFADAFISYAEWEDGTELSEEELIEINEDSMLVQEHAYKVLY